MLALHLTTTAALPAPHLELKLDAGVGAGQIPNPARAAGAQMLYFYRRKGLSEGGNAPGTQGGGPGFPGFEFARMSATLRPGRDVQGAVNESSAHRFLPQPLGPTRDTNSPRLTSRSIPSSARTGRPLAA